MLRFIERRVNCENLEIAMLFIISNVQFEFMFQYMLIF